MFGVHHCFGEAMRPKSEPMLTIDPPDSPKSGSAA